MVSFGCVQFCGACVLTWIKLEGWRANEVWRADFKEVRVCCVTKRVLAVRTFREPQHQERQISALSSVGIGTREISEMTSLRQTAQHIKSCNPRIRGSYAEISRFARSRHHGISSGALAACTKPNARSFGTAIKPETQEALNNYGKSCKVTLVDYNISNISN